MTDSDLLMVENLTYFNDPNQKDNPYSCSGVKKSIEQCDSMDDFLKQFDDTALNRLDSGNADCQEWAARIRYMRSNKEISSLLIKECNTDNNCILFEDAKDPNHAIVAFKGTTGGEEWFDNATGLKRADTDAQLRAKEYIESLGYDSITVTGHSKGGNKAMYVAVTCDKVDRCISYDGQGFSREFIDKYSVDIQNRGSKIKNYSLANDYVHVLMFPVPGSEQIYMEPGNRVDKIGGAHYPIGPFRLKKEDGKWYIDETDGIIHIASGEYEATENLHEFTTFLMNNMSSEELKEVADFLAPMLKGIFRTENEKDSGDDSFDISEYVMSNRASAAKIFAYLLKYLKENDMGFDELIQICESVGIKKDELFKMVGAMMGVSTSSAEKLLHKIFDFLFDQITDGKDDAFINFILGLGLGDDAVSWWKKIEDEYKNIKPHTGSADYVSLIRDYSQKTYNVIIETIESFEKKALPDVSSWNDFSAEKWFSKIMIAGAIKCINGYKRKLSEINAECKRRTNETFENIDKVDKKHSKEISSTISDVRTLALQIKE
ncbi:MAG: DUF2974 domain-containing protein [Clostridiales bacterium]|nr:DUF2974 domain-containing protein [Clostridiales bacterium]